MTDTRAAGRPVTPLLAADIIIELDGRIVLIERRHPPYGWALPGGFVDVGERVEHAAVREAAEETGLAVRRLCLLGCYSDPARDARGHTASMVYVASAEGEPQARDDARAVALVDPLRIDRSLAFDHDRILQDYRVWRVTGRSPAWSPDV
ncbi:MAG: NUDIX hydrolase [Chromatiales bacterium]|jgi:8-oxo-dGTP diphosphatase|nr:NUDIX hydrolase [Chromatiales bacterium]